MIRTVLGVALVTACGGSPTPRAPQSETRAPATAPAPAPRDDAPVTAAPSRPLALPVIAASGTLAAESWAFVTFEGDRTTRVGAVPESAVGEAGIELAALPPGEVVHEDELLESLRKIVSRRAAMEPPPPPPRPAPPKKKTKKPARERTEREKAIEAAVAAGILSEKPRYPSCGDPMGGLTGSAGGRPPELAPMHATACPIAQPDTTAGLAALLIADRDTPAAIVLEPFMADHGGTLARLAVTTEAGTHARTLAVQLGQTTGHMPLRVRPAPGQVLVLDGEASAASLAQGFAAREAWIWVKPDATYRGMIELVHALTVAGIAPITLTLEDPR